MTRHRFAFAAALLLSCGPPPQQVDPILPQTQTCATTAEVPTDGLALVVGLGGTGAFKVLTAGAELPLQHGSQGGTHVYVDVLFHTDVKGPWKLTAHLARPNGSQESESSVITACVGWNRVDDMRLVLYAGGGEGDLDVRAAPTDDSSAELKSAPVAVTIR